MRCKLRSLSIFAQTQVFHLGFHSRCVLSSKYATTDAFLANFLILIQAFSGLGMAKYMHFCFMYFLM